MINLPNRILYSLYFTGWNIKKTEFCLEGSLHELIYITNKLYHQCRSKGNISGGARERRRREPLGGCGGMLPQKIVKSRGLEMLFPAFSKSYLWFTHIANYLLRTLSQQTNSHSEYNTCNVNYKIENRLYISVSWNQQMFHLSESS